jgi:hypothetical protein
VDIPLEHSTSLKRKNEDEDTGNALAKKPLLETPDALKQRGSASVREFIPKTMPVS